MSRFRGQVWWVHFTLNILQISSARSFGGGERHVIDLSNSLAGRGHNVYLAVRPNSPLRSRISDVPIKNVYALPLRNALDAQSANALRKLVKQQKIEIIHAHMARDYSLAAYALRGHSSARLIVTRHVLFPLNRLQGRILARAAYLIAVSAPVARQVSSQHLLPESRIRIVPNGVDVSRLQKARSLNSRERFCLKYQLPKDSVLIGSTGQLNPLKGHDVFLKAASIVSKWIPNTRFLITGEDPSSKGNVRMELERLKSELKLEEHVRLLGRIDQIESFLSALDVFVSASHTESFGLAIAEAMATGLPVVATSTEGALELLVPGKTGLLVPLGDAEAIAESILNLARDSTLREEMGQRAYQEANARFRLDKMVDAIESIYIDAGGQATFS